MRNLRHTFFNRRFNLGDRVYDYVKSSQIKHFYALQAANLDDLAIISEICRRGATGHYFTLVLLQLHAVGLLTDKIKQSLMSAKLETLEKCVVVIVAFYATSRISDAKKSKLRDSLRDEDFRSVVEILLKNQLLSLASINALMRVNDDFISEYSSVFETLIKHAALSEEVVKNVFSFNRSTLKIFNDIITRLTVNRESGRRDTHSRVMDLFATPWLLSQEAYDAIWSRASDCLNHLEFDEIVKCATTALAAGYEPSAADFQDPARQNVPLRFIFFRKKRVLGENEQCLMPYENELDADLFCMMTQRPMTKPVRVRGGNNNAYEQDAIEDWLKTGRFIDPGTNLPPTLFDPDMFSVEEKATCFFIEFKNGVVVLEPALDVMDAIEAFKRSKGIGVAEKNEMEFSP